MIILRNRYFSNEEEKTSSILIKFKNLVEDFNRKFPKSGFGPSLIEIKGPFASVPVMNFSYDDQDWFNIGVYNEKTFELIGDLSWNWKNIKKIPIKVSEVKGKMLKILKDVEPDYGIKSDPAYKWFIQKLDKF